MTGSSYYVTLSKEMRYLEKPIFKTWSLILDSLKTSEIKIFVFLQQQMFIEYLFARYYAIC